MKKFLAMAFFILFILTAYSASMQAPSIGARATGMGGAFVSIADDPSSLFYNPAGLGLCEGTLFMKGEAFIAPYSYYEAEGADKEKSTTTVQMIPNIFFTHNFNDSFSMGLGYYVPFGLGQRWKDDAALNYNSTRSEISLQNLQAGASFKLTDDLLVGAGLAEGFSKMNTKSYSIVIPDGGILPSAAYVKTEGEGRGTSGNIGFLWSPSSYDWTVGGVWQSETNVKFKGEVDIGGAGFTTFDREISMDFTFPQTACLGVSYSGFDRWLLSGQVDWVNWSRMDTITQKLDDPVTFFSPPATVITTDEVEIARDWKDRYIFRIGAEYEVTPEFALRGGYMWDPSPVSTETLDPMMFDVSNNRYFVGASFPVWTTKIDVAYAYSQGIRREAEDSENIPSTDGDYWGHSHMFEISTTYTF